ncbi:uncharacterized protein TRIADDRAFT_24207, partial [Trichoplax adhaerens]
SRPEESFFRSLDSSVKRNTTFVKKLRTLSDQQRDSIFKDAQSLNLTKYVPEVVSAILESKMKLSDVSCAIQICCLMHQRYSEFATLLLKGMQSSFTETKDDDKSVKIARYRVTLRLLGELIIIGVFNESTNGTDILHSAFSGIITIDKATFDYLPVVISFCRHFCEDFFGITPRKNRLLIEKFNFQAPASKIISDNKKKQFRLVVFDYHAALVKYLEKQHKEIQRMTRQNLKILHTKGELNEERKENLEKSKKSFEKLHVHTGTISDILDLDMPDLPQDEQLEEAESFGISLYCPFPASELNGDYLWEDEETRSFYENLKDLKTLMPAILFKESESSGDTSAESNEANFIQNNIKLETIDEISESIENLGIQDELKDNNPETSDESKVDESMTSLFDTYLRQLATCRNRDFIDEAATEFITNFNTKGNRKALVRSLFNVPRTRLDLLPFYARLVATLTACFSEIGPSLNVMLMKDFMYRVRKKDQIHLEEKIKAARFIGELTKFRIISKDEALLCLKVALNNFTHHVIDMACCLLETCGRFLLRNPDSHIRTKNLLETMMRIKSARHLEERYVIMIENAYYHCLPPEDEKVEVRTPLQEYIRRLVIKHLITTNVEKILRQFRKLSWNNQEIADYAIKFLSSPWYIKYNNIHNLANLLSGLAEYREDVAVMVVDNIMEEIRLGLEINAMKLNQRRIATIKYLGELYNYQMIEADVIFNTLYSLITFGLLKDHSSNDIDPPDNFVRLRLVSVLLDTCGEFFDRGFKKSRLDCFLVYVQHYFWQKKSNVYWETQTFPIEIENLLLDLLDSLRPKLKPCNNLTEAKGAIEELEQNLLLIVSLSTNNNVDLEDQHRQRHTSSGSQSHDTPTQDDAEGQDVDIAEELEADDTDAHKSQSDTEDVLFDDRDEIAEGENEDVTILSGGLKAMPCEEDDDFQKEYEKALADDLLTRRQHGPKVPSLDAPLPFNRICNFSVSFISNIYFNVGENLQTDDINFVLLTRKSNKLQYKEVNIPVSDAVAANIREKIAQEKADKEEMKRLVLSHDKRQQEESFNGN